MEPQVEDDHGSLDDELIDIVYGLMNAYVTFLTLLAVYTMTTRVGGSEAARVRGGARRYSLLHRIPRQLIHLHRIVGVSDEECINHLRMNRGAFSQLCHLLETSGGLRSTRNSSLSEQLAMFLSILAHHTKTRIVKSHYNRSGRTVSKNFHRVLNAIIKCHARLLVKPVPIDESCTNDRWRSFQGCLGALDGTYVDVTVAKADRARYRNRKGAVSVNVLAVCDIEMNFVYVLSGWEGSAADARVLRDAVARPHGLRVPRGNYYLCDSGYSHGDGFLTPYRGARYHLGEWVQGARAPQNKEEYFNMKHSRARNVIERAFGILKKRWAILRSTSFYPIKIQNRIIMACCLLHNFIRRTMDNDPVEDDIPEHYGVGNNMVEEDEYIDVVEPSPEWAAWRDNLAQEMWDNRLS